MHYKVVITFFTENVLTRCPVLLSFAFASKTNFIERKTTNKTKFSTEGKEIIPDKFNSLEMAQLTTQRKVIS